MQIELEIDGIDCGHCAEKIEEKVRKMDNVEMANLNFINKTMKIFLKNNTNREKEVKKIIDIIKSIENNAKIYEKKQKNEKIFVLEGLTCGHCAEKIEEKVEKMESVEMAKLNFINKTIKINFSDNINKKNEIEKIRKLIKKIDSNVTIKEKERNDNIVDKKDNVKFRIFKIVAGIVILCIASVTKMIPMYYIAYVILGYDVILKALKNITKGRLFDENFLMSIATIGAFFINEYAEGVAVMLFYQIGEFFQEKAVGKSRDAIKSLVGIKAEYATKENGEKVDPEDVMIGETIVIKAGERVPLDGIVLSGNSFLDMSALIGESVPRKIKEGEEILSGSINNTSVLKIKVTKEYENSTISKILDLVENSTTKKSKVEGFISKFAKIYTPTVVIIALLLAIIPPLFMNAGLSSSIEKSLVFLVCSCPCALVVSIPLSLFSGIGQASKKGILIKGSMYVQNLSLVDTIVFDKTGTLTKGVFEISKINPYETTEEKLLETAYILEKLSIHPVAKSIVIYCEKKNKNINEKNVKNFEEMSGLGLKGDIDNEKILVGNSELLKKYNVKHKEASESGTVVYVAKNGIYLGYIIVSDIIKNEAKDVIKRLKSIGIKNTIMLSGDRKNVAEYVGAEVGVSKVYSDLLPQDKVEKFEQIVYKNNNRKVAFVGDGINDAPVIAISDVGFAMGGVGSDIAIETADIVIMNDDLNKIYESIIISKNTMKIVKSNVIFSLVIKFGVLGLALIGFENIWGAIFADVGVTVIAILNAMRKKIK